MSLKVWLMMIADLAGEGLCRMDIHRWGRRRADGSAYCLRCGGFRWGGQL